MEAVGWGLHASTYHDNELKHTIRVRQSSTEYRIEISISLYTKHHRAKSKRGRLEKKPECEVHFIRTSSDGGFLAGTYTLVSNLLPDQDSGLEELSWIEVCGLG